MGFSPIFIFLSLCFLVFSVIFSTVEAQGPFNCSSSGTCDSIVDYKTPNATTLSAITSLFGVENLRDLLGANNFPLSTTPNQTVPANQTIRIPFPCLCTNGTGTSHNRPVYKVVAGDGLYHIAAEVFSGLVTFQQIQVFNHIVNADLITEGQELLIPLPCSCDEVDGERVVHYGHLVANGNTVEGIARDYNTTEDTLLKLNRLASPNDLKADSIIDVPLKACASMVTNRSLDYPLLVPNGTYVFTAHNCVTCRCDAANNFILQCAPTQLRPSIWQSCPSMQCQGGDNLYIGNSTSSSCNRNTCAYGGFTNQTILTSVALESTCPVPNNGSTKLSSQGWRWNFLLIAVQLVLYYLHH